MDTPRTAAEDCHGLLEFDPAETLQPRGRIAVGGGAVMLDGGLLATRGNSTYSGTVTIAAGDGALGDRDRPTALGVRAAGQNGSAVAMIAKVGRLLETATTIEELRNVENLAQLARDCAKKARLGRDSINAAARLALDAQAEDRPGAQGDAGAGRAGGTGKKPNIPAWYIYFGGLGLTANESSRYQQEAGVPPEVYEAWVQRVIGGNDGVFSATGLRTLARQLGNSDKPDGSPLVSAVAVCRIRRLVAKRCQQMRGDGRACLPAFLKSFSGQYEGDDDG